MESPRSPKCEEVRSGLSQSECEAFDELVEDYRFFALKHHRGRFVSYQVLAELIRSGWRCARERQTS
jgi:hypothetical protein